MDTINVCEACVYLHANGADEYFDGHDDALEACIKGFETVGGISFTYPEDDPEGHGMPVHDGFSRDQCGVCGTFMGGTRYACTYWMRDE